MVKYKDIVILKLIGDRIRVQRIKLNLDIEDIAEMTGFAYNTISNVENGLETNLSYFIQICFALNIHPKFILDIEFDIKPRFPLSASRNEKSRLTPRIVKYIESGYFKRPRSTNEVLLKMKEESNSKLESKTISAILLRFVKDSILQHVKNGNKNYYSSQ